MSRKQRDPESCCSAAPKLSLVVVVASLCAVALLLLLLLLVAANRNSSCLRSRSSIKPAASFSFVDAETRPVMEAEDHPPSSIATRISSSSSSISSSLSLSNIVFGIAATARLWERRKAYVRLWWRPNEMRGFVWLDEPVANYSTTSALPPCRLSASTARFKYTHRGGRRSALRISRVVSETFRVGLPDARWFVMADDDTLFVPDNLVALLAKYDHRKLYYIGASSESHHQNLLFSYAMAYGGGGFAISYALASALERRHDECLERYPYLYGSDDRIHACVAELGVPLTREPGFHQLDVHGDVSGLLAAHPIAPFVSMHHLDVIHPVFPEMSQVAALRHLSKAIEIDAAGVLQQSMCYERKRAWSISVAFGYAVTVMRGFKAPRELEIPARTFASWNRRFDQDGYSFTTRAVPNSPCETPVVFHMKDVAYASRHGMSVSNYTRTSASKRKRARCAGPSPEELRWIQVVKDRTDVSWFVTPRRQCCQILSANTHSMRLLVRDCKDGELIL